MHPVKGRAFFIDGRFERLPKSRIARELAARGGELHHRLTRRTDIAVLTHAAAGRVASPRIRSLLARDASRCLSEEGFLRILGLAPPLQGKDIDAARFETLSGLAAEDIRLLALFDLLAAEAGRFGFADLKVAQHVAGLLRRGVSIEGVLAAATALRRRRRGSDADMIRLDLGPDGDLMMRIGETLAGLDGQMRFSWVPPPADPDMLFEAAEEAEAAGDLATAERLYYACLGASPRDAVVRFNLANVVRELGRLAEAKAHYLAAIEADPGFPEAHFNLGHLAMAAGHDAGALAHFERAVAADPDYPDALYNLAMLHIRLKRPSEAVPLLERYLRLDPGSEWSHQARKLLLACKAVLAPARASRIG